MSLDIVVGPMFSGKSSYALSYVRKQLSIGKKCLVIKPNIDVRYTEKDFIITHDKDKLPCFTWDVNRSLNELLFETELNAYDCFVIDESQFYKNLYNFCNRLLQKRKHILLVGLDGDSSQKKFGELLEVIPLANHITKLNALCSICKDGTPAPYTKTKEKKEAQVDVGGAEKYISVCLAHLTNDK